MADVKFSNGIVSIGRKAFENCALTDVVIPDSVTRIESYVFYKCSDLKSVVIPNGVTDIGAGAFGSSGLTSIVIPASVINMGDYVFHKCSDLTNATILGSIPNIGIRAFKDCSLISVTIPRSVTNIKEEAFAGCTSLADVYYQGNESDWSDIFIDQRNDPLINAVIHYESAVFNPKPEFVFTETGNLKDAVLYVPYSNIIKLKNVDGLSDYDFKISDGNLPKGLNLNSNTGEIYGIPSEMGEFVIKIEVFFRGEMDMSIQGEFSITVKENTDTNIHEFSDERYILETHIGEETDEGYVLTEYSDQLLACTEEYGKFIDLWLNGDKLIDGEDYTKENNKIRLIVKRETFEKKAKVGRNTIVIEFRDMDNQMKCIIQNFIVNIRQSSDSEEGEIGSGTGDGEGSEGDSETDNNDGSKDEEGTGSTPGKNPGGDEGTGDETNPGGDDTGNAGDKLPSGIGRIGGGVGTGGGTGGSGGSSGSGGSGGSSGGSSSGGSGGSGGGSSSGGNSSSGGPGSGTAGASANTQSAEGSWINDGIGWWFKKSDGTWPVNTWYQLPYMGTLEWYYFNENGYMVVGWMENQGRKYYLSPISDGTQGKMCIGWQQIEGRWYYFNEISDGTRGALMTNTQVGEYYVNEDGVWVE